MLRDPHQASSRFRGLIFRVGSNVRVGLICDKRDVVWIATCLQHRQ